MNEKLLTAGDTPSVTVKLKLDIPFFKYTGDNVAVQFGAVPLNTILATGNNTVFDDVAVTDVVQLNTLSTSLIVKFTASGVSCTVV